MTRVVWVHLRRGLAFGGFALALLAVAYEDHRIGWGAIALLAVSLLVRVVTTRDEGSAEEPRDT